jgi:oxygen-independent coproporphyrinogen-3 oxidase
MKKKEEMVMAIAKELQMRKTSLKGKVETIYFGGGTNKF